MESVLYSTNGDGRWFKTVIPKQCRSKVGGCMRCQGVEGHDGDHWAYDPAGRYCFELEKPDAEGIICGECPASHPTYKTPLQMERYYYMGLGVTVEVANVLEIDRLNRGNLRVGETISRPVDFDDLPEDAK